MSSREPPVTLTSAQGAIIFHGFALLPDGRTYLPIEHDLSQPFQRIFLHEILVSEEVEIEIEISADANNNEFQNVQRQCHQQVPCSESVQEENEYQELRNAIQALNQAASDPCLTQIQVAETSNNSVDLSQCTLELATGYYTEIIDDKTQILIQTRNDDTVTEDVQECPTHSN